MEKKAKCKYCGEEFVLGRGKKTDHCKREACLRKAKNEAQRKWYANKMKVLEGAKTRIVEQKEEKKVVYSSTDRAIHSSEVEDFSTIITIARELGAIAFKIEDELKKCSPEQSKCDKYDEIFLHDIEDLLKKDVVYEEDIIEIVKKYINNRPDRRYVKDKQQILNRLKQGIILNPNEYVAQFIKNRDKRTYNPKIKEEIK